eukprot:TRINITY_DN20875_c0_g2_i3.p2 TRINITY_DN20875_c0_g2~~TRINITY_DN20875_c0_g2_i3.p2  ORF type:complete len:197 (-),score=33.37 TRINITY_DN20875_c0_g2_i3:10-600(-)
MRWLFMQRKTPAQLLRKNKRLLNRAIRELDRERMVIQNQEKKLALEIRQLLIQNNTKAAQAVAKTLLRNRRTVTKMYNLRSLIQAVELRVSTLKSQQAMGSALKGISKAMKAMTDQLDLPALQKVLDKFQLQNERMESANNLMSDAFEIPVEEEESEELLNQMLDELRLGMENTPTKSPKPHACPESPPTKYYVFK